MPSLASLPSFPCLDAWPPIDQKRFHLGTEGDHNVFLGLLAFLPLLGFQGTNTLHTQIKTFHFVTETIRPSLACLPSFICLASLHYKRLHLCRYRMIANFDNLGYQGFPGLQYIHIFQQTQTNSNTTTH